MRPIFGLCFPLSVIGLSELKTKLPFLEFGAWKDVDLSLDFGNVVAVRHAGSVASVFDSFGEISSLRATFSHASNYKRDYE